MCCFTRDSAEHEIPVPRRISRPIPSDAYREWQRWNTIRCFCCCYCHRWLPEWSEIQEITKAIIHFRLVRFVGVSVSKPLWLMCSWRVCRGFNGNQSVKQKRQSTPCPIPIDTCRHNSEVRVQQQLVSSTDKNCDHKSNSRVRWHTEYFNGILEAKSCWRVAGVVECLLKWFGKSSRQVRCSINNSVLFQ